MTAFVQKRRSPLLSMKCSRPRNRSTKNVVNNSNDNSHNNNNNTLVTTTNANHSAPSNNFVSIDFPRYFLNDFWSHFLSQHHSSSFKQKVTHTVESLWICMMKWKTIVDFTMAMNGWQHFLGYLCYWCAGHMMQSNSVDLKTIISIYNVNEVQTPKKKAKYWEMILVIKLLDASAHLPYWLGFLLGMRFVLFSNVGNEMHVNRQFDVIISPLSA